MKEIVPTKIFVADLIVVSIWALCAVKFTPEIEPSMIIVILSRITLCFLIWGKSRWAAYSTLVFALAYFVTPKYFSGGSFQLTITQIINHVYHVINSDAAARWSYQYDSMAFSAIYYTTWSILVLWLFVLPFGVAIRNRLFKSPKWSWLNVIALAFSSFAQIFLNARWVNHCLFSYWIVITCGLPGVYWVVKYGKRYSIVNALLSNRLLMLYLGFVAVFISAFVIGLRNIYSLMFIGFLVLPSIFYILICKAVRVRDIPTFDTLAMSICGVLYWYSSHLSNAYKITALSFAVIILVILGWRIIRMSNSFIGGIGLLLGTTFILCPFIMGMNPYVVIGASHTRPYLRKAGSYNGLYVVDNYEGKYGLRDRYGEILPMDYYWISILEDSNDNILCCEERIYNNMLSDYTLSYRLFDLNKREFIPIPSDVTIREIKRVRDGIYALYNEVDFPMFYLVMPWNSGMGFYTDDIQLIDYRDKIQWLEKPIDIPEEASELKSPDGKLCFYSWDTGMGGTSPDYASYVKYVIGNDTIVDRFYPYSDSQYVDAKNLLNDGYDIYDGSYISELFQMDIQGENPLYIVVVYQKASSIEGCSSAFALQLVDGKLIKRRFINANDEIYDRAESTYYIPDWYFTTDGLGWPWVMSFDEKNKALYVPQFHEDLSMNDRYDLYRYENGMMRYKRTDGGFWLNPSLRDFKSLLGIYQTYGKLIRIDEMQDETFRYVCWDKPNAMLGEPELILTGGETEDNDNTITFTKDSYQYIVPKFRKGQGDDFRKIIIKKDGKVIREMNV